MKKNDLLMMTANNCLNAKERQSAHRDALDNLPPKEKALISRSAEALQDEIPKLSANGALELLAAIGIKLGGD